MTTKIRTRTIQKTPSDGEAREARAPRFSRLESTAEQLEAKQEKKQNKKQR